MYFDAERAIRNRLFLQGDYNPEAQKVQKLIAEVMEDLHSRYGALNVVRRFAEGNELAPLVEKSVKNVMDGDNGDKK